MIRIIATLLIPLVLVSCQNNTKKATATSISADTVVNQIRTTSDRTNRDRLIAELQKLKIAFHQKDKLKLSTFFKFPLADEDIFTSGIDATFDSDRTQNGNTVTEAMFRKHFDRLYEYFQMHEFDNLFYHLNLDNLLQKNEERTEKHYKDTGCYFIYEITVNDNSITLFYGTNSDSDYLEKHPNDAFVCAEHAYGWVFTFDGQKLYFKKLNEAG